MAPDPSVPFPINAPSDDAVFPLTWYAVHWSRALERHPLKRRIAGRDLVFFRTESGAVHCLEAYCAHRGADLSLGRCHGERLVCGYHGWEFDAFGACRRIPSAPPERPIPAFARVRSFPVQEKAGLIWVYPNVTPLEDLPPLTLFPELDDPGIAFSAYDAHWRAHLTRVVESVLDVAHVPFVHRRTIGRKAPPEVPRLRVDARDEDSLAFENGDGQLYYRFPNHWILRAGKKPTRIINYVTFTPSDRDGTWIFGLAGRTFATGIPGMGGLFSWYSRRILQEDRALVESQHPRPIPEALRMEAHVPADAPQVRFRRRWFNFLVGDEPRILSE